MAELSALDVSLEGQGYDVPSVAVSYDTATAALAELASFALALGPRLSALVDEIQAQVRVDDVRGRFGPPIEPLTVDLRRMHDVGGGRIPFTVED